MRTKFIMVINGPNLNLLGRRRPDIYGSVSLQDIERRLGELADELRVELEFVTSNHEGEIVDAVQRASGLLGGTAGSLGQEFAGIIINPGALSHYSIAIRDTLEACPVPAIEVHLTNIYAREAFRSRSVISPVASGVISGLGPAGYELALRAVAEARRP